MKIYNGINAVTERHACRIVFQALGFTWEQSYHFSFNDLVNF